MIWSTYNYITFLTYLDLFLVKFSRNIVDMIKLLIKKLLRKKIKNNLDGQVWIQLSLLKENLSHFKN